MDAYARQITPGEYPFAVLMVTTQPGVVDVNVHPRKSEVKFVDGQKIYRMVYEAVQQTLGEHKVVNVSKPPYSPLSGGTVKATSFWEKNNLATTVTGNE